MRALLLAAGIGSRLAPLTNVLPKCLMPINGHPLLSYWLSHLVNNGINEILINLHHHHQQVVDYINDSPYKELVTLSYEEQLLGTAGTLLKHRGFFAGQPVMLIHADNLSNFDMSAFIHAFQSRPAISCITMMSFTTDAPSSCGILELDKQGLVKKFHEKVANPPGNLANAAVYILDQAVMDFLVAAAEQQQQPDFSNDVIPHFMGRINSWHNTIYHRDIGNIESLMLAQAEFEGPMTELAQSHYWIKFWGINKVLEFAKGLANYFGLNIIESNDDSSADTRNCLCIQKQTSSDSTESLNLSLSHRDWEHDCHLSLWKRVRE